MEDQDILDRLAARQYSEAFTPLVERYKNKVFRLASGLVRQETLAEDLTQEVFLKIWKALPTFHGGATLSTWIYTITRNTCLTELSRRHRQPTISLQDPGMEAADDWVVALQARDPEPGLVQEVDGLLAQLPEAYRQVITLFYLEQKAYEEVARALGLPLGTVKTLLFRAKKALVQISQRPVPVAAPRQAARHRAPAAARSTGWLAALRKLNYVLCRP